MTAPAGPRELEQALHRDDPVELQDLVVRAALESPDAEWAEWYCTRLARHRNATVRGNAIEGFGRIAERFGELNRGRVHRLVETALHARNEYVRERAEATARDLETLLAWTFERPSREPDGDASEPR